MEIFIVKFSVKARLRLLLWVVGVAFFGSLVGLWHTLGKSGEKGSGVDVLYFVVMGGMLAVTWAVIFVFRRARQFIPHKRAPIRDRLEVPWSVPAALLVLCIVGMGFFINHFTEKASDEFELLRAGRIVRLEERIRATPGLLEKMEGEDGETLVMVAVRENRPEAVEMLLANGAQLDPIGEEGLNLMIASLGNLHLLETLLEAGVDPKTPDSGGIYPIHHAVSMQGTNAIGLLLAAGADVNACDPLGQTPLMHAVLTDNPSVAGCLLRQGADVDARDQMGDTALHRAVRRRNPEIVRLLLARGADPETFNSNGLAPLHIAAYYGQTGLLEIFLESIGHVDLHNEDGRTAFDHALRGGHYDVARLLLGRGADINRVRADGQTALHTALAGKKYQTAQFLIEEGADVHMANSGGESAYDMMQGKQLGMLLGLVAAREDSSATAAEPMIIGMP